MDIAMGDSGFDGIVFADTWQEMRALQYAGRVIHILCLKGNMGFTFQDTHYNISSGDYVILPNAALVSNFSASDDFQGILMNLSEAFVTSIAIRSNYGIIGHLSLLRNPVMKLSERDFRICGSALQYLRMRMEDERHFFREELLGSLLTAHILDLYDLETANSREPLIYCKHDGSLDEEEYFIALQQMMRRLAEQIKTSVGDMQKSKRKSGLILD